MIIPLEGWGRQRDRKTESQVDKEKDRQIQDIYYKSVLPVKLSHIQQTISMSQDEKEWFVCSKDSRLISNQLGEELNWCFWRESCPIFIDLKPFYWNSHRNLPKRPLVVKFERQRDPGQFLPNQPLSWKLKRDPGNPNTAGDPKSSRPWIVVE